MNVSSSYRRGILTVVAVVVVSAILVSVSVRPRAETRAAWDLGNAGESLGSIRLTESSGRPVTEADLADRVCIVAFIFTRCQLSCPRISGVMKNLQERFAGTTVLLLSLSVDPEHDTPEVLRAYGQSFGADSSRWWFLTGPRSAIYDLIRSRFKLSVAENPEPDPDGRTEAIAHSERLALVNRGRIVGLFDSTDVGELEELIARARRLALPEWVRRLPSVNAILNGLCALWLAMGWIQIRREHSREGVGLLEQPRVRSHVICMILAVITSAVFLASYLVYHYQAGSVAFRGQGFVRHFYLTVLLSHTVLASFGVVPLVIVTLLRAWRREFSRHRAIAAITFPIWLYVSVTGVLIYLMLYQLPVG